MSATPRLRVLLVAQAAFMIGFASVVPFLAVLADDRFALGPAAIGAIVGARVAVQQGLFLVGGALADRFGPRALLLSGCAVRAGGFVLLALAPTPAVFVAAVLLIGVAGALFSPAVDAYVGEVDAAVRAHRRPPQPRAIAAAAPFVAPAPFAALALAGEAGGIVGAVVGALLMPAHALEVTIGASVLFAVALAVLAGLLPSRSPRRAAPDPVRTRVSSPPRVAAVRPAIRPAVRPVVWSAAGAATVLPVYTQLFSLLPLDLARRGIDGGWVGAVSAGLSVTILAFQWPLSRVVERLTRPRAVVTGVAAALIAAVLGAVAAVAAAPSLFAVAAGLATVSTAVAVMLATPSAQSLLAGAGSAARRATRLGALASAGGLLALGASAVSGAVAGALGVPAAWLGAALLPAAGLVFACIGARTPSDPHPREDHHDHSSTIPEDRHHRRDRPPSADAGGLLLRRRDGVRRGIR